MKDAKSPTPKDILAGTKDPEARHTLISQLPLFAKLPQDERRELISTLKVTEVPAGTIVAEEGKRGSSLYFVLHGRLKVCHSEGRDSETIFALYQRGDFFGEIGLLCDAKRSVDVVSLSDCVLLELTAEQFYEHAFKYPGFSLALLKAMAERLRLASQHIVELSAYDLNMRIASHLLAMAVPEIRKGKQVLVVKNKPTIQQLAAMIGSTKEKTAQALDEMEELGLMKITPSELILLDLNSPCEV